MVSDVVLCVMGISVPWIAVNIGLVQHLRVLTPEVSDGNSSGITGIGLWEHGRNYARWRNTDALLFPRLSRIGGT